MKKILILVPTGYEDVELIAPIDIFDRNEIEYVLASVENKKTVKGQTKAIVETELIDDIKNINEFDGVFLPGGMGHKILLESDKVMEILDFFNKNNKLISAICAAPEVLVKAGVVNGRKITSYPGFAQVKSNTQNVIEVDENLVTGKDFEASIEFAKKVVEKIQLI